MAAAKPIIVIIPGAWHSPEHYSGVTALLQQAGYSVLLHALPSVDPQVAASHSICTDTTFIRENILLPLLEEGKDMLLVMHSYGGCPGSAAAKGLSKKERTATGRSGGVIGLVFLAGFLFKEGDSLFSRLGGKLAAWHVVDVGCEVAKCCALSQQVVMAFPV